MTELHHLTATQVLCFIRQGKLTVEDYSRSLLARIQERDHVQAWECLDTDLVVSQAKSLDSIPPDKRGPLHGIAIGIKDVALTKGAFRSMCFDGC